MNVIANRSFAQAAWSGFAPLCIGTHELVADVIYSIRRSAAPAPSGGLPAARPRVRGGAETIHELPNPTRHLDPTARNPMDAIRSL